jgi:tRNA (guanine-N7-)-methyltransferase
MQINALQSTPGHPSVGFPALPSLIYRPTSIVDQLDVALLFPVVQPLEVELGSGDGSFLLQYAQAHPEHNFLGIERLLGRLRKLDRKGLRARLTNLRLIRLEASYAVEYLLPEASASVFHIYFPDPWPKRRHRPRRLVNASLVQSLQRGLAPEGRLYLRTDDADYFAQMTEVIKGSGRFQEAETPLELRALVTDFERDFMARELPVFHAAYQTTKRNHSGVEPPMDANERVGPGPSPSSA